MEVTRRQWIILQTALLHYRFLLPPDSWDEADGPLPTGDEVDEIVRVLGAEIGNPKEYQDSTAHLHD